MRSAIYRVYSSIVVALVALSGSDAFGQAICDVDYQINGQWPTGAVVTVVLENPGVEPVDGWTLRWSMPGDERITEIWNGAHTQAGTSVEVNNLSYNGLIPSGGSVTFGFVASTGGAGIPTAFELNGTPCGDAPGGTPNPPPSPGPFSRFVFPADGDIVPTSFMVQMEVGGLTVEPAGPVNPGAGHLHILVDTDFVEPGQSIPFDGMHLHYGKAQLEAALELEPGPHTLRLQFADGEHVALAGDEYVDEIQIVVAENMIIEPADNATVSSPFTVRMQVEGLTVEPAGEINPGRGHLHLLVDTDFVEPGVSIPFDAMHLHYGKGQVEAELDLPPGPHTIKLQFADGAHVAFDGPQYRDEIRVVVAEDGVADPGGGDEGGAGGPGDDPEPPMAPPAPNGEALYASQCAGCHGDDGKGLGTFPSVLRPFPSRVAYLQKIAFDMPLANPASCGDDCAAAVTQYIEQVLLPAQGLVGSVVSGPGGRPDDGTGAGGGNGGGAAPPPPAPIQPEPPLVCNGETPGPRVLRLLTGREYDNTVQDLLSVRTPLVDNLPVEARILGYDNNAAVNVITARHVDAYLAAAQDLADRAMANGLAGLLPCDPARDPNECARQFVQGLGLRAYRRPLSGEETQRLVTLVRSAPSFEDGMRQALTAMLISPNFLYRSELGEPIGGGRFRLTSYEMASVLSYLFTGSMPDQALFDAAARNQLQSPQDLVVQAQRLIRTPAAREQIGVFAGQWLGADPLQTGEKDARVYPNYTRDVQTASDAELVAFVNHVIFNGSGLYSELFNANYVFANQALARFYGLNGVNGNQLQQLPVSDGSRGGVLGLASVLAAHAHSDDSSPVKRGVFVRKRLLCHELPAPPPAIDNTPPGLDPTLTTRERFAAHSASPFCQTCHQYIDGVGFGLEGYNGAGEFRRAEFGMPVDDSGSVKALSGFQPDNLNGAFPSVDFNGLRELSGLLATSPDGPDCLATQYFRYSRGYIETDADACTVDALQNLFEASDYDLETLLIGIVRSPSFSLRRAGEGQ